MQVAALSLQNRQKAELQLKAEKQTAHELAQMQDTLNREEMLWTNAHHSTVVTEALTAGPAQIPGVQTSNTPSTSFMSQIGQPVSLPDPAAPGPSTALVEKPKKLSKKYPDFFKSETISSRYHECVGDGQCSRVSWSQGGMGWACLEQAIPERQLTISGRRDACLKQLSV